MTLWFFPSRGGRNTVRKISFFIPVGNGFAGCAVFKSVGLQVPPPEEGVRNFELEKRCERTRWLNKFLTVSFSVFRTSVSVRVAVFFGFRNGKEALSFSKFFCCFFFCFCLVRYLGKKNADFDRARSDGRIRDGAVRAASNAEDVARRALLLGAEDGLDEAATVDVCREEDELFRPQVEPARLAGQETAGLRRPVRYEEEQAGFRPAQAAGQQSFRIVVVVDLVRPRGAGQGVEGAGRAVELWLRQGRPAAGEVRLGTGVAWDWVRDGQPRRDDARAVDQRHQRRRVLPRRRDKRLRARGRRHDRRVRHLARQVAPWWSEVRFQATSHHWWVWYCNNKQNNQVKMG